MGSSALRVLLKPPTQRCLAVTHRARRHGAFDPHVFPSTFHRVSGFKSTPEDALGLPRTGLSRLLPLGNVGALLPSAVPTVGCFPAFRRVIARVPMPSSRLIHTFEFRLSHARHAVERFRRGQRICRTRPAISVKRSLTHCVQCVKTDLTVGV